MRILIAAVTLALTAGLADAQTRVAPAETGGAGVGRVGTIAPPGTTARSCKKCTAYCQTVTVFQSKYWTNDLGPMTPSQCMDQTADACKGYNSLLLKVTCTQ